jgi:NYN domain
MADKSGSEAVEPTEANPAQAPKRAVCLVDYDNLHEQAETCKVDVEQNLIALRQLVIRAASVIDGGCEEIRIRLYGGWRDERRRATVKCLWVVELLSQLRGREGRLLLSAELVYAALCRPADVLTGTYRRLPPPPRQKMVDTMMVVDVVHLLRNPEISVVILSDDDDLIPAVLMGHEDITEKRPLHWVRKPRQFPGYNDDLLRTLRVRLHAQEVP